MEKLPKDKRREMAENVKNSVLATTRAIIAFEITQMRAAGYYVPDVDNLQLELEAGAYRGVVEVTNHKRKESA